VKFYRQLLFAFVLVLATLASVPAMADDPFPLDPDPGDVCAPIPGVRIPNQPFEVVPPRLIQGYITEFGVLSPHLAVQQILSWQRQLTGKKLFGDWKTATS